MHWALLRYRAPAPCFTCFILFNCHDHSGRKVICFSPFYRRENWSSRKLSEWKEDWFLWSQAHAPRQRAGHVVRAPQRAVLSMTAILSSMGRKPQNGLQKATRHIEEPCVYVDGYVNVLVWYVCVCVCVAKPIPSLLLLFIFDSLISPASWPYPSSSHILCPPRNYFIFWISPPKVNLSLLTFVLFCEGNCITGQAARGGFSLVERRGTLFIFFNIAPLACSSAE